MADLAAPKRWGLFMWVGSLDLLAGVLLLAISSTSLGRAAGGIVAFAGLLMLFLAVQGSRRARGQFR